MKLSNEKLSNILISLIIGGGTGITAHYAMSREFSEAIITAIIAGLSSVFVKPFLEGISERWKPKAKRIGEQAAEAIERPIIGLPDLSPQLRLQQRFNSLNPIDETTGITEAITWGEYQLFLADQSSGKFHSTATMIEIDPNKENEPVSGINWVDGLWFCAWLGTQRQLQTEGKVFDYDYLNPHSPPLAERKNTPVNALKIVRFELPQRYATLQNYLANARWKDADNETCQVMLEVAGRSKERYLDVQSIETFPCEDLRAIDQLWLKYSGGHFGFSVQKEIWLQCGGKVHYETDLKLGELVGWRKNGKWMYEIPYELHSSIPMGQLPWTTSKTNIDISKIKTKINNKKPLHREACGRIWHVLFFSRKDL